MKIQTKRYHQLVSNKRKGLTEDDEVQFDLMVTMIKGFNVHVACDVECGSHYSTYRINIE